MLGVGSAGVKAPPVLLLWRWRVPGKLLPPRLPPRLAATRVAANGTEAARRRLGTPCSI